MSWWYFQPSCPPAPRSARSLVNQEAIRIDTRLSVYGNASDFLERAHLPPICVQPSIYISILFMLIVFASAALISLVAAIKSRKRSRRSLADALWIIYMEKYESENFISLEDDSLNRTEGIIRGGKWQTGEDNRKSLTSCRVRPASPFMATISTKTVAPSPEVH